MANSWKEQLQLKLVKAVGAKKGKLLAQKYENAFPHSYTDEYSVETAAHDIQQIEQLSADHIFRVDLYEQKTGEFRLHCKLYQYGKPIPLSDILPMLENLDLRTYTESSHELSLGKQAIWISDFSVTYSHNSELNISRVEAIFEEAFGKIQFGTAENDGFNKLILAAELSWREVSIIRAYAKYLHQTGFRFNQAYIEKTMLAHAEITKNLVKLFNLKFCLKQKKTATKQIGDLNTTIQNSLEKVTSLEDDRILRRFWDVIKATLRTNYFQTLPDGESKEYISFKLNSAEVPELPLPHPLYEVFVYSPRFEAIHLRAEKVARGGIRWSDRREDFRTEILALMKAQKVKNAIIVPSGAKGGFVLKKPIVDDRNALNQEVIACYKSFIRGLLDLTDNLQNNKVVPPKNTVCYDTADTYLVVAADKGTASFSDTANNVAKEYDFWLGDAFASGGSAGYDHKKMGITARGAWESIKRHFRELDINLAEHEFTAVGIGDMSGDVFGNGMLYTAKIKLIAAFDHRHIFLDPTPHPQKSYDERARLFNLPTSSWEDYNPQLISTGGGVYKRSSKSIVITPEVKKALGIEDNSLAPNELIRAILRAPVELLYNGGIGTYVKAEAESQADVGDKTNEFCRINGNELRCKVVGEGGNLGFTQLGRIEYALMGGLINTDFIDNSAGVDCSDHEVNIKILLDKEVAHGRLTEKKRNQLLVKMTNDVAQLVLRDNYNQALVMSFSATHSAHYTGLYLAYMKELESSIKLDRLVEFLPDEKRLLERKTLSKGLTRPEIAVLLANTKIHIKNEILKSTLPDDPYFLAALESAFPAILSSSYAKAMQEHRLHREIIATQLSNQVVNSVGITFVYRLQTETGLSIPEIVRAYTVAAAAYDTVRLQKLIDSLNFKVPMRLQYELLHHLRQLLNLATRWFLRGKRLQGDITKIISRYRSAIDQLEDLVSELMVGVTKEYLDNIVRQFVEGGLSKDVARKIATTRAMYTALNITEIATQYNLDLVKTAKMYFEVGGRFNLVWFRDQIASDAREGHWNTMARLSLRDELDSLQRSLSIVILQNHKKAANTHKMIAQWITQNEAIQKRWEILLELLHGGTNIDYTMFFIALRELSNMVQLS